ncbi:MAG TPA: hypothetical protein VGN04_06955 [Herbaspirillum sp.]
MTDMRDLKQWQAAARKAAAHRAPATHQDAAHAQSTGPEASGKKPASTRIAATRDPFAPSLSGIGKTHPSGQANAAPSSPTFAETPVTLRLLGTVRDNGTAYALIESGKQVHCVALHAALPSYPITVTGIADQAIEIDHALPDGSHRRSTLRQGE